MTHSAGITVLAEQQAISSRAIDDECLEFDQLIRDHQLAIDRTVRRLMAWPKDQAHVDDVVQDVFLKAWQKRHSFRGDADQRTWLTQIAINQVRNYVRRRATWNRIFEGLKQLFSETKELDQRTTDRVRLAIGRLKNADREIIVLRYLEEKSPDEIALMMNLRRNTVDARLSRARKRLEELLRSIE